MRRTIDDPLEGLQVFERGWLSSNNLLIRPAAGERGALLVDSSHTLHADQTVALLRRALGPTPLARVVNTHLHSDHCGGNAALAATFGAEVLIPPGESEAVRRWDEPALSHHHTGQVLDRFGIDGTLAPGDELVAGGRAWSVLPAPGHDPHAVLLHDAAGGVLLSADALWENGYGVVFPEVVGEPGFDDVGETLDRIERLHVRLVVPGHGAPFTDVAGALGRARRRLAGQQADPARHAQHAIKVLLKYHLMECRAQDLSALMAWATATPLVIALWERYPPRSAARMADWVRQVIDALVAGGALVRQGDRILDA